jgi:hypothetical protein
MGERLPGVLLRASSLAASNRPRRSAMRRSFLAAAVVAAGSLGLLSAVHAEDPPPRRPPPDANGAKPDTNMKKEDPEKLRVEKAKKLATPVDAQMLQILMTALEQAKELAKAAKPDELTKEEKDAVVAEAKKEGDDSAKPGDPKDPMTGWQEKALEKAFADTDLSEEETIKAKKIIGDWWTENLASMGDSKKQSDLKRKRDDDLEKALGKKSRKVINNLNAMRPGGR